MVKKSFYQTLKKNSSNSKLNTFLQDWKTESVCLCAKDLNGEHVLLDSEVDKIKITPKLHTIRSAAAEKATADWTEKHKLPDGAQNGGRQDASPWSTQEYLLTEGLPFPG